MSRTLDDAGSDNLLDFLPKEPAPGNWFHVVANMPISYENLNRATAMGWDMVAMVPWREGLFGSLKYVLYFQYKDAQFGMVG